MSITVVASLIAICKAAMEAGKGLKAIVDERLSDHEKEILREGASRGQFSVITVESFPILFCNSTGRDFSDTDPATAAKYLEAFQRLCHRGFVVPCDGELFQFSGSGFELARKLKS